MMKMFLNFFMDSLDVDYMQKVRISLIKIYV